MLTIKKYWHAFRRLISRNSMTPKMIVGYKRFDKKFLPTTRISNTTFIDHQEHFNIEDNVYISHYNFLEASHGLTIEEGVQIANFCNISTHSSHIAIRLYGKHYCDYINHIGYVKGPIHIGAYSFIGPHSTIMPNTTIGKGSIVKAYSYVHGEFPDFSIIGGNPAIVIGSTKDIDNKYLENNQELATFYTEWAKK